MPEQRKSLSELAKPSHTNPSQLGDPISLKAETSDTSPTEHDLGAKSFKKNASQDEAKHGVQSMQKNATGKAETLSEKVKRNPTALGDPVSLKSETGEGGRNEDEDKPGSRRRNSKFKLDPGLSMSCHRYSIKKPSVKKKGGATEERNGKSKLATEETNTSEKNVVKGAKTNGVIAANKSKEKDKESGPDSTKGRHSKSDRVNEMLIQCAENNLEPQKRQSQERVLPEAQPHKTKDKESRDAGSVPKRKNNLVAQEP